MQELWLLVSVVTLRSLFCLFLSGRFTQILLYIRVTGNSTFQPDMYARVHVT